MEPQQTDTPKTAIKVLIVEDDEQIQRMYVTMFGFRNLTVDVASDGVEGLEKAKALKPEVILLDVMMPNMDGIEMLEKVKTDPDLKDITVIMLSNLTDETNIQESMDKGALKYIVKSEFTPRQVAELVESVIQSKSTNQQPAASENTPTT